jgi:Transcriptional regulator, AbiEi antitoxin/Protein of unknown function (DUF559)
MASKSRADIRDRLEERASAQFGVLSRAQLRECGMSRSAIQHAVRANRLHPIFRGVFALGRRPIELRGRLVAATLACGEGAVVSHRTAASLFGLLDSGPVVIDVIASGRRGLQIDGIRRHEVRVPRPWEVGAFNGVPCTSPARTLVDVAEEVGDRTLRSCFERAAARGLLEIRAVEASLWPGRPGAPAVRALLDEWRPALPIASAATLKSPLEAMVLPLLAARGIPAPRCNARVALIEGKIEVDFLWAERRFVVEADSRDFHGTEAAFERDRWRDRELMRAGYGSLRVTRRQAEREPEAIADAIGRELASRKTPAAQPGRGGPAGAAG